MLTRAAPDLPASELVGPRSALVRKLTEAYWGELETMSKYVASATNRDSIHAPRIAQRLREAITSNLDHAQRLAIRIKQLHAPVPGPGDFSARQLSLRAPAEPDDSVSVLNGVVKAETAAIDRYRGIVALASEAADWITEDLAAHLIREKDTHRHSLQTYLAELTET
jgi:bacterioferritin